MGRMGEASISRFVSDGKLRPVKIRPRLERMGSGQGSQKILQRVRMVTMAMRSRWRSEVLASDKEE